MLWLVALMRVVWYPRIFACSCKLDAIEQQEKCRQFSLLS
jgi:hypothetical protein